MKIGKKMVDGHFSQDNQKKGLKKVSSSGARLYRAIYADVSKNNGPFSVGLNMALALGLSAISTEVPLLNCKTTTENLNCIGLTATRVVATSLSLLFIYRLMKSTTALLNTKQEKTKELHKKAKGSDL